MVETTAARSSVPYVHGFGNGVSPREPATIGRSGTVMPAANTPRSARALRERLNTLNRERGQPGTAQVERNALADLPEAIAKTLSPSLAERLARLRPWTDTPRRQNTDTKRIAALLGGTEIAPGVIRIERTVPLPWRHGNASLPAQFAVPQALSGADADHDAHEVVLFDTETTGLAGGTGTVAFMLGALGFRDRSVRITQWLMLGFGAEAAMLESFAAYVANARMLVTFNGATFDLPLLRTRLRMHSLPDATAGLAHVDLLGWARRNRRTEWGDVRLQTLEREGLGFHRNDDLPGDEVPKAWQGWLRAGETGPLARALEHNRNDLLTLAALLGRAVKFPGRPLPRAQRPVAEEVQPWLFDDPAPWIRVTRTSPALRAPWRETSGRERAAQSRQPSQGTPDTGLARPVARHVRARSGTRRATETAVL